MDNWAQTFPQELFLITCLIQSEITLLLCAWQQPLYILTKSHSWSANQKVLMLWLYVLYFCLIKWVTQEKLVPAKWEPNFFHLQQMTLHFISEQVFWWAFRELNYQCTNDFFHWHLLFFSISPFWFSVLPYSFHNVIKLPIDKAGACICMMYLSRLPWFLIAKTKLWVYNSADLKQTVLKAELGFQLCVRVPATIWSFPSTVGCYWLVYENEA